MGIDMDSYGHRHGLVWALAWDTDKGTGAGVSMETGACQGSEDGWQQEVERWRALARHAEPGGKEHSTEEEVLRGEQNRWYGGQTGGQGGQTGATGMDCSTRQGVQSTLWQRPAMGSSPSSISRPSQLERDAKELNAKVPRP